MKKFISGLAVAVVGLSSFGQGAMIDDAVSWLYNNGYTIFSNTRDYKPDNYMRRDEAAKFFVKVAEGLGKTDYVKSASECSFSDLDDGHADLKDVMIKSCRLGIFQGHEGKFMPKELLTNEQAVAVFVRVLYGSQVEMLGESGDTYIFAWSDNYYKKAYENGLLKNIPSSIYNRYNASSRGNIGLLVFGYANANQEPQSYKLLYNEFYGFSVKVPDQWDGYKMNESIKEGVTAFSFWFEGDNIATYSIFAHSIEYLQNEYDEGKLCEHSGCLGEKTLVGFNIKSLQQSKNYIGENKRYIFTYGSDQRNSNSPGSYEMGVREYYIPFVIQSFQVYN